MSVTLKLSDQDAETVAEVLLAATAVKVSLDNPGEFTQLGRRVHQEIKSRGGTAPVAKIAAAFEIAVRANKTTRR